MATETKLPKAPVSQAKRSSLFHCSRKLLSNSVAGLLTYRFFHVSNRGQLPFLPKLGPVRGIYTPSRPVPPLLRPFRVKREGIHVAGDVICLSLAAVSVSRVYPTIPPDEDITRQPSHAAKSLLASSAPTQKAPSLVTPRSRVSSHHWLTQQIPIRQPRLLHHRTATT